MPPPVATAAEPEPPWYHVEQHFHSTWRLIWWYVAGVVIFVGLASATANGILPLSPSYFWVFVGMIILMIGLATFSGWMVIRDQDLLLKMGRRPKL